MFKYDDREASNVHYKNILDRNIGKTNVFWSYSTLIF